MIRRWTVRALFVGSLACAAGCSVLLDWNDFSGGGDAGGDAAAGDGQVAEGGDAPTEGAPTTCTTGMQCTTTPPAGWTGPVALYVATTGSPPPCGAGFASTPAFDGNANLTAAAAPTCSACGCGAPTGESCNGPVMSFYLDSSCDGPSLQQTVTSQCSTTLPPGAMSATVAAPLATGGTCAATGGTATTPPVVWGQLARACSVASAPGSADCSAGQVCVPTPSAPFSTNICVMQAGVATACPVGYATGPQVFYSGVDDERACTPCECGAPTGGQCTIVSPAITNCLSGPSLDAPNACTAFTGGEPVKLANTPVLSNPGTCAVASGGVSTGTATPTGATSFCCVP